MNDYLKFAKKIANYARKEMLKNFNDSLNIEYKEDNTIVTNIDKKINDYLIKEVKRKYPAHSIDGEENQFGQSNYIWVCDPIDGTAMYARKIPIAVFSLALVIDGIPTVAVVYDPFTNNLYSAIKNQGAYKNNTLLQVNNYNLNNIKSIGHCDINSYDEFNSIDILKKLHKYTRLSDIGSIARAGMCVASGEFTFAIFLGKKHKNCDIAAIKLIVEEAGGIVSDLYGNEQRYDQDINGAIISNQKTYKILLDIIKENC